MNDPAVVARLGGGKALTCESRARRVDLVMKSSFILTAGEIMKETMTEELSDLVPERLAGVQQATCKYPLCQVTSCPSRPVLNVTSRGHSRLYRDLVRKLG